METTDVQKLPEAVREFLGNVFYMWDTFPPSWMKAKYEIEEEDSVRVIMTFDGFETYLDFMQSCKGDTSKDENWKWYLEEGETSTTDLGDFHAENRAFLQMLFNMRCTRKHERGQPNTQY